MTPLAFQTTPKYRSGACAIDWSHPITRGMFDCLLWNDSSGAPVNLCPGTGPTTLTSSPTMDMTAAGPAGYATGGSSFDIPDHGSLVGGDSAVRVLFLPVSWPSAFTVLIDKGNPTGSHREICVFFGTTGDISFACYGNDGGASLAISTGCTAGLVWDFVASKSGNTVTYYVNGVSKGTGTSTGTAHIADPMCFGRNVSGGGSNGDIKFIAAQTWTRALDVSEVLDLYHNPYGFTIAPENTLPSLNASITSILGVPWQVTPQWLKQRLPPHDMNVFINSNVSSQSTSISGMAWFEPSDRLSKPTQKQQPGPAVALTPDTLPPKISGMGWFIPPDGYDQRRFYHPLVILQDANSFGLVFVPNPPAAPLADRVTFTFNFGIDF